MPFWRKGQKDKKYFLEHLIPYILGLRIFQKSYQAQTMRPIALYNNEKNW